MRGKIKELWSIVFFTRETLVGIASLKYSFVCEKTDPRKNLFSLSLKNSRRKSIYLTLVQPMELLNKYLRNLH